MEAQGFPTINQPFVDERGYVTQSWRQLLVFLWKQLGAGGGNAGTLLVNPGTGDNTRELNVALADYANVNDYLNTTDTHYDGAIARALSDKGKAYFPAKPYLANPGNYYRVISPVLLSSGHALIGDGAGVTKLVSETADQPVISLGENMYWFHVRGMTIAHVDNPAVAGGDGIFQAPGATYWVDNALLEDLLVIQNYHGLNLGKAFKATIQNVFSNGNNQNGFNFLTNAEADVNGTLVGGPMQWVLFNCAAQANGYDGYAYTVSGTGHGGYGVGTSLGTLTDCVTFANGHHGVSMIGTAATPLHGVRIEGGFFGDDGGQGIYMDTYGVAHILRPNYMELARGSNIYITANNTQTMIEGGMIVAAYNDGITSIGAVDTIITGGAFRNNGVAGGMGIGATWAGIRIDGGSAQINGIRALDSGSGIQSYGVSVTGDDVLICGCRLTDNALAPIAWGTGPTNSIVTGCLPISVNTGTFGDVQVNSLGIGVAPDGFTGNLRVGNAAAIYNGLTVTGGGIVTSPGAPGIVTDNITVNDLTYTGRLTVASGPNILSGTTTAGTINASTITTSVDLTANGTFHAYGGSAFQNGINVLNGGMAFTTGVPGNGIVADNITLNFSVGVGVSASGTAGRIDLTSAIALNGVVYTNP